MVEFNLQADESQIAFDQSCVNSEGLNKRQTNQRASVRRKPRIRSPCRRDSEMRAVLFRLIWNGDLSLVISDHGVFFVAWIINFHPLALHIEIHPFQPIHNHSSDWFFAWMP